MDTTKLEEAPKELPEVQQPVLGQAPEEQRVAMGATPGPWNYCGNERGGCTCMQVWCADHPIARVESGVWGDTYPDIRIIGDGSFGSKAEAFTNMIDYGSIDAATAKANARLIAAAPELLEALKIALEKVPHQFACHNIRPTEEWNSHGSMDFSGCCCERSLIEKAIAKATVTPPEKAESGLEAFMQNRTVSRTEDSQTQKREGL